MSTLDLTASNVDGGRDDLIRCQLVEKQADGGDIGDSIHGADFMEVDLAYRFVVGFAFGFCDEAIDRQDIGANGFRKFQVVDDMMDIVEAAVGVIVMMVVTVLVIMIVVVHVPVVIMVMVMLVVIMMVMVAVAVLVRMFMIMAMFIIVITVTMVMVVMMLVAIPVVMMVLVRMVVIMLMVVHVGALVQDHIKVAGVDAALEGSANLDLISIHMEACQRILQHLSVCPQIKKRSYGHITADSRITFQV